MNWNIDIRDLSKRQVALVATGIVGFGGLLTFLVSYGYTVAVALLALVIFGVGRWHLWGKGK